MRIVRRARTTSSETSRRFSRRITTSAVCFARPDAAPKATPAVAMARAGASLTPSPIIMTPLRPCARVSRLRAWPCGSRSARACLKPASCATRGQRRRPDRRTGAQPPYRAIPVPRPRRALPAGPGPRAESRQRAGRRSQRQRRSSRGFLRIDRGPKRPRAQAGNGFRAARDPGLPARALRRPQPHEYPVPREPLFASLWRRTRWPAQTDGRQPPRPQPHVAGCLPPTSRRGIHPHSAHRGAATRNRSGLVEGCPPDAVDGLEHRAAAKQRPPPGRPA